MTPSGIWTWTDWRDMVESSECLESLEVWDPVLLGAFASSTIGTIAPPGFCVVRGSGESTATLPEQASKTAKGCKRLCWSLLYFSLFAFAAQREYQRFLDPASALFTDFMCLNQGSGRESKGKRLQKGSVSKSKNTECKEKRLRKQCRNSRKLLHGMHFTKKSVSELDSHLKSCLGVLRHDLPTGGNQWGSQSDPSDFSTHKAHNMILFCLEIPLVLPVTYRSAEAERSLSTTRKLRNWNYIAVWWGRKCQTILWHPQLPCHAPLNKHSASWHQRWIMHVNFLYCQELLVWLSSSWLVQPIRICSHGKLELLSDLTYSDGVFHYRFMLAEEKQKWKGSKRSLQCMLNLLNSEPRAQLKKASMSKLG